MTSLLEKLTTIRALADNLLEHRMEANEVIALVEDGLYKLKIPAASVPLKHPTERGAALDWRIVRSHVPTTAVRGQLSITSKDGGFWRLTKASPEIVALGVAAIPELLEAIIAQMMADIRRLNEATDVCRKIVEAIKEAKES